MLRSLTLILGWFTVAATAAAGSPRAPLININGETIGTATLRQLETGTVVELSASGLPPGTMGVHFHETGRCDTRNQFKSAGGHYAPEDNTHGFASSDGPHAGDMPNLQVGEDGKLDLDILNTRVSLDRSGSRLLDDDGAALIIHANADDGRSQPSGQSGKRIACAAFTRQADTEPSL
ncbi:MAG: superoxide dismutase family protein [Polycyclovorans sp.]|jgi:superoxide dismutase, Cu-Zn family|nr:superoxide dismutase family protein [Polycyclovorans sp.]